MGGRSRIFVITALALVVINIGLAVALVQQRDQASLARDQALLEGQLTQLNSRLAIAREVESRLPALKAQLAGLQSRYRAVEPRLYKVQDQAVIEASLTRMASSARGRGPGLTVDRIETRITDEQPPLKEHTFNVHLRGKMTLLPAIADQFYDDPMLSYISRFAAVSPDMRFLDLDMEVRAHYYEADLEGAAIPGEKQVLAPFTDIIGPSTSGEIDPRLADLGQQVNEAREALTALHPALVEAAAAERRIQMHLKLQDQVQTLVARREAAERLATENLPKLYLRVRGSPLGGAALLIQDDTATFPNYVGDE